MSKERRLGRGLAALLGDDNEPVHVPQADRMPRIHQPEDDSVDQETTASEPPAEEYAPPSHGTREAEGAKDGDLLLLSVYEIDDNPFRN